MAVKASQTITLFKSVDVSAVTLYFKTVNAGSAAPAKPTTATPSGWSTSEPTLDITKDLYATLKSTFTDSTFSYSNPQKYSSYEAAKTAYNTATAANTNANTALSRSIEKSTTAPTDTNHLWLDLSEGTLKQYVLDQGGSTGTWQVINDFSDITGALSTDLEQLTNDLQTATNELTTLINTTANTWTSQMQQTSQGWTMQFQTLTQEISGYVGDLQEHITEQNKYIRFLQGTITLGDENSMYSLKLENDKIQMLYNSSNIIAEWDTTRFSAPTIKTSEIIIKESTWSHQFKWIPNTDGSLSFRKVSD